MQPSRFQSQGDCPGSPGSAHAGPSDSLDQLLSVSQAPPENPWFATKVLAAVTCSQQKSAPFWIPRFAQATLLAIAIAGFLSIAYTIPSHDPLASEQPTPQPTPAQFLTINLDALLDEYFADLWISEPISASRINL